MKDKSRKSTASSFNFNLDLLDPRLMDAGVVFETAIGTLEGYLLNPTVEKGDIVRSLLEKDGRFELVYSTIIGDAATCVEEALMHGFPSTSEAEAFEDSLAALALSKLSYSLQALQHSKAGLVNFQRLCTSGREALAQLTHIHFGDDIRQLNRVGPKGKGRKNSIQSEFFGRYHRSGRRVALDVQIFEDLGLEVPGTDDDVTELKDEILAQQRDILHRYLQMLREPELASAIRDFYRSTAPDANTSVKAESMMPPILSTNDENLLSEVVSGAFPAVQPLSAAMQFENAKGFGPWRILVSTRAGKNIREARNKGSALFNAIVNKLNELSNGYFNDSNHKRLNGSDGGIPVYEAWLATDARLVYHIHCTRDHETGMDQQAIRVFGVYNHAQLNHRLWNAVGQQLKDRGAEYKKRCIYRCQPNADGTIPPKRFPALNCDPAPEAVYSSQLKKEDFEELHSLLVLEKFTIFSQAFVKTILADQEVAYVFETSALEQEIIQYPGSCYVLGRSGTGKTTTIVFKMLGVEKAWQNKRSEFEHIMIRPRQLFVTQSRVLAKRVEQYYMQLARAHAISKLSAKESRDLARAEQDSDDELYDEDEEEHRLSVLPPRYSELKDEDFPLFLSFDQLCRLLEADNVPKDDVGEAKRPHRKQNEQTPIPFDKFRDTYWKHFPQNLTKGEDPALVFAEFMGVIQGSELSLSFDNGYIDRESYLQLNHHAGSMFADRRESLYELFRVYCRMRGEKGGYDLAQRSQKIVKNLEKYGLRGEKMDYLYVDEVQDNLLVDAKILRMLCRNPNGLFWAGDTAQTISAGSSFRFNDLKSFLYRLEESNNSGIRSRAAPEFFQLAVNYRSHGGIVNCAQSVVQLITRFWPHTIDKLEDERGIVPGSKPSFLNAWDEGSLRFDQILSKAQKGEMMELGAHQCILVRDEDSKARLEAEMGKEFGIVMTIWESKGLEYDDVFLLNFFQDSTVDASRWRVLLQCLSHGQCPNFDESRHRGLCRELKILYVGITRARKNLWIFDSSKNGEPMRLIWEAKGQIDTVTEPVDLPQLINTSSTDEWVKRARTLFKNKNYEQARFAFGRAGKTRERDVANAYYLRQKATKVKAHPESTTKSTQAAFEIAAKAFQRSAQDVVAISKRDALIYFLRSADCYKDAGNDLLAAQMYERAEDSTSAAKLYRKIERFDDAVRVVRAYPNRVESEVAESILMVAKMYYMRNKELGKARDLLKSDDEAVEYMKDLGLEETSATFLEFRHRYLEAAELHIQAGRMKDAAKMIRKHCEYSNEHKQAAECILNALWRTLSLTPYGISLDPMVESLLKLSSAVNAQSMDEGQQSYLVMFRALIEKDIAHLKLLSDQFYQNGDGLGAFICLEEILHARPSSDSIRRMPTEELITHLEYFLIYVKILQDLFASQDNFKNRTIQYLLGLSTVGEDLFQLRAGTSFYTGVVFQLETPPEGTLELAGWQLQHLIKHFLSCHLRGRFEDTDSMAREKLPISRICLHFAQTGWCNYSECWNAHVEATARESEYNWRVQGHLLQIMICDAVQLTHDHGWTIYDRKDYQLFWLRRLYETLHPITHKLGSFVNLEMSTLPVGSTGVVLEWIRERLSHLNVHYLGVRPLFLSDLVQLLYLHAAFLQDDTQQDHASRIPARYGRRLPMLLLRGRQGSIIEDMVRFFSRDINTISGGIAFAGHVIKNKIRIDPSILLDLLDEICCSLIISRLLQSQKSLHNTVIPQHWIVRILHAVGDHEPMSVHLGRDYIPLVRDLLVQLFTVKDAAYLHYRSFDLSQKKANMHRNIFILRICENLCFLGENIRDVTLQQNIHYTLSSLMGFVRTQDGAFLHPIYARYVNTPSWPALMRVFQESRSRSDFLPTIQLLSSDQPDVGAIPGVKPVPYKLLSEITGLIGSEAIYKCKLNVNYTHDADAYWASRFHPATTTTSTDTTEISGPTSSTEEHLASARKILRCFQMYKRNRALKGQHKEDIDTLRSQCFSGSLHSAAKMEWEAQSRLYQKLYRGPLPHILVCIRHLQNYAHSEKKAANKLLMTGHHHELENIGGRLKQATDIIMQTTQLITNLEPRSSMHGKADINILKNNVEKAKILVESLPEDVTEILKQDLSLGVKGILVEAREPVVRVDEVSNSEIATV